MRYLKYLSLGLSALLLAACAATPDRPATAKPSVRKGEPAQARALARWKHLIASEFTEAYEYLSPGYRQTKPRDIYVSELKGRPVHWKSVESAEEQCPPGEGYCDVTVAVVFEVKSSTAGVGTIEASSPVVERWIDLDGVWYLVPKDMTRR